MSNKQGLELIVEAAAATRNSHPSLQYVLCGNGPVKPTLSQMASGLDNVHFLDLQPQERVSELLNTADIHLLPQKVQISDLVLPSKLAGMLASGRPVVAMAVPGTGIASETEGAGLVIPPGDAQALASAIVALAGDAALRARLGAVARARAEQKWDRVSIMRSLEREFLALPQRTAVAAPRPLQPATIGSYHRTSDDRQPPQAGGGRSPKNRSAAPAGNRSPVRQRVIRTRAIQYGCNCIVATVLQVERRSYQLRYRTPAR